MAVTMQQLGERAGVSAATVSRALRNDPRVAPQTYDKVLRASQELGYITNGVARSLRVRSTMAVGIILDDISNPVQAQFTQGAAERLMPEGYFPIIGLRMDPGHDEVAMLERMLERGIDGLLWSPRADDDPRLPALLARCPVPVVFLDRRPKSVDAQCVVFDHFQSVSAAVQKVISAGHERIAFLAGPLCALPGRERKRAYEAEMRRSGLKVDKRYLVDSEQTVETGYAVVRDLLQSASPPTALMTCGTRLGVGALRALRDAKTKVPRELSVLLVAPPELADVWPGRLDVVEMPVGGLGRRGAELLLERMRGISSSSISPVIVPCSVVAGNSVASPRAGV